MPAQLGLKSGTQWDLSLAAAAGVRSSFRNQINVLNRARSHTSRERAEDDQAGGAEEVADELKDTEDKYEEGMKKKKRQKRMKNLSHKRPGHAK